MNIHAYEYGQKLLGWYKNLGDDKQEAFLLGRIGVFYKNIGRYDKAVECQKKALKLNTELNNEWGQAYNHFHIGLAYRYLGWYDKGKEHLREAMELLFLGNQRQNKEWKKIWGLSLLQLAEFAIRQGNFDAAREYLWLFGNDPEKYDLYEDITCHRIGNFFLDINDPQKAEPYIKRAQNDASLGRWYLMKKDYQKAKKHYENLLTTWKGRGLPQYLFAANSALGFIHEQTGDLNDAERYYTEALNHTEALRSAIENDDRTFFFDVQAEGFSRTMPYDGLARVLWQKNKWKEALEVSDFTKARAFSEALYRRSNGDRYQVPKSKLDEGEELYTRLAKLKEKQTKFIEETPALQESPFDAQIRQLEEALQHYKQELADQYPSFLQARYPTRRDVSSITQLKKDEWVLEYHVTDTGVLIYLLHDRKVKKATFRKIERTKLRKLVQSFRKPFHEMTERTALESLNQFPKQTEIGKKLYEILIGNMLQHTPPDHRVIIVPDDCLANLPFEMLVVDINGNPKVDISMSDNSLKVDLEGVEFLWDRHSKLSYYQSITALTLVRSTSKPEESCRVLIIGNPDYQGTPWPPLKSGNQLVNDLRNIFSKNAEILCGSHANHNEIVQKIAESGSFKSIVFAVHGHYSGRDEISDEPILALSAVSHGTDGYLRMGEVMNLKMAADVVALVACQTGLGRFVLGEGTMGMGRAFQFAGARSVLMSLWSVAEISSFHLITYFFEERTKGKNKLDALNEARRRIRAEGFNHPFFWAGFILAGDTT